jgi:hypothetical protein
MTSAAQHLLGDVGEDQLQADRRDPGDLDVAKKSARRSIPGHSYAIEGHYRRLAGMKAGLGGAVFVGIGIAAGLLAAIGRGSTQHQSIRPLPVRSTARGAGAWIAWFWPICLQKNDRFLRAPRCAVEGGTPEVDRFRWRSGCAPGS